METLNENRSERLVYKMLKEKWRMLLTFSQSPKSDRFFCPTNAPKHKYSSLPAKMMKKDS